MNTNKPNYKREREKYEQEAKADFLSLLVLWTVGFWELSLLYILKWNKRKLEAKQSTK